MECLKRLREERHLRQIDVADALSIDRTTYNKYENDKSHPDHDMLKRIAEFYGVSIDYLLDYEIRIDTINAIKDDVPFPEMIKPSDYDFFHLLTDLTPEEKQRVRDFVAGLKSSDKA